MAGRYLLDTNAAIALLNGDTLLAAALSGASSIFLRSVAAGELYFGAFKSGRTAANVAAVEAFHAANVILGIDQQTGRVYGQVKAALRTVGRPIPDNDLWIAATAQQHGLTLVTRD